MKRRQFLGIVAGVGGLAGCSEDTGEGGQQASDSPSATETPVDQQAVDSPSATETPTMSWTTVEQTRIYSDSTFPFDLEDGEKLRVTLVNERGYDAYAFVMDEKGRTYATIKAQTKNTTVITANHSSVYYVDVLADEVAVVTIAKHERDES